MRHFPVPPGTKLTRDSEYIESLKQDVRDGYSLDKIVAELQMRGISLSNSARSDLASIESDIHQKIRERLETLSLDSLCEYQPVDGSERQARDSVYYGKELARRRSIPLLQRFRLSALDWQVPLIDRRISEIDKQRKDREETQRRRDQKKALLARVHNGELKSRTAWAKAGRIVAANANPQGHVEGAWATWPVYSIDQTE